MVSCSAFGCTSRSEECPTKSFHRIPPVKKLALRRQWLQKIRRAGEFPKDYSFIICSGHFEESSFKRDLQVSSYMSIYKLRIYKTRTFCTRLNVI